MIAKTLERPAGESHWSVRRLAEETGVAPASVHRIWRVHRLRPHQTRTFKYSTDPELEAKVIDICGLYLDPPEGALVLCVDEKTQIQALDRTQPILPCARAFPRGAPTTTAATAPPRSTRRSRSPAARSSPSVTRATAPRNLLRLLRRIVREHPAGELHIVLDNSSTHSTPEVNRWLARHRRVHFTSRPRGRRG